MPAAVDPAGAGPPPSVTERTRHRRLRALGQADRAWLYAVLDAGMVAHLGVVIGGWALVLPTPGGVASPPPLPPVRVGAVGPRNCRWPRPGRSRSPTRPSRPASPHGWA